MLKLNLPRDLPQEERSIGAKGVMVLQPEDARWKTPGLILADKLNRDPEVRLVLERLDPDRPLIVVAIADDREEVLDRIFAAESDLYRTMPSGAFDLRVTRWTRDWDETPLLASSLCHLKR